MNRYIYFYGNFILALSTICGLSEATISLLLGAQIYVIESYPGWYLAGNLITLAGSVFILKYYHYKNYKVAFSTGAIFTNATLCYFVVTYIFLVSRTLRNYYVPSALLVLVTGTVYSVTLIFSNARERKLLTVNGVLLFIMNCILLTAFIWGILSTDEHVKGTLAKVMLWTIFTANLFPILLIRNFLDEARAINSEDANSIPLRWLERIVSAGGYIAFFLMIIFGSLVANETHAHLSWAKHLSIKAKEWEKLFETESYVDGKGDTLRYQLLKPLDYNPKKKYPLIVCLPFGGGVEGAPPAQVLINDGNRSKYPAFLFVPNCKAGLGWGGVPGYPTIDTLVFETIQALEVKFEAIDVKRIYVTGVSRGGYGTWHFICTRPEMFAAAIPICGGEDAALAKKIKGVSVWAFHGRKDRNVPVKLSRDMIEGIINNGGSPRYTEFPDAGHDIWDKVQNTPGLLDWIFAQKRQ